MLSAFGLGTLAQSSLLLAGLIVCWVKVPSRVVGVLAGLGAGAMLAAISFDLVVEADELAFWEFGLFMLFGVAVFLIGDRVVEKRFGDEGTGGPMGIVVGSVVDGVPESLILGIQLATGLPISVGFIARVFVSTVPSGADRDRSVDVPRLGLLWTLVVRPAAAPRSATSARTSDASPAGHGRSRLAVHGHADQLTDPVRLRARWRLPGSGGAGFRLSPTSGTEICVPPAPPTGRRGHRQKGPVA